MGQTLEKWIVLISKVPSGPFSIDEVRELLRTKAIRSNDVAFRYMDGQPKNNSGWKLLWQFPEFDRRSSTPAVTISTERRKIPPVVPTPAQIHALLPEELSSIRPEDLVPSPKKTPLSEPLHETSFTDEKDPNFESETTGGSWVFRPAIALITVSLVVGLFYLWKYLSHSLPKQETQREVTGIRPPQTALPGQSLLTERPIQPKTPQGSRPDNKFDTLPVAPIIPPDTGQIPPPWIREQEKKEALEEDMDFSEEDFSEFVKFKKFKDKRKREKTDEEDETEDDKEEARDDAEEIEE